MEEKAAISEGGQDSRQHEGSFGPLKAVTLTIYVALVAWMIPRHEPWSDEAQAWLLARDSSLWDLLFGRLHYEGSPGLWHILLWLESRLGVSYAGMHWTTAAIAMLAIYLLLRYSPFPRWMQVALPFSVPLLYQAPIVARSYVLSILFMFLLALLYRQQRSSVYLAAVLCGFLANTALFGCALSAGFALLFLWKELRAGRRPYGAAALLLFLWAFAVVVGFPAPDLDSGLGGTLNTQAPVSRVLSSLTEIPLASASGNTGAAVVFPAETPPANEAAWQRKLWQYVHWPRPHPPGVTVMRYAIQTGSILAFIVSSFVVLVALFYATALLWLIRHRALHTALPFALMVLFALITGITEHHALLLWAALVACLWMAWPSDKKSLNKLDVLFAAVFGIVLLQQIIWSVAAYRADLQNAFDPGVAVAHFIENTVKEKPGQRVAGIDFTLTSSQPFFVASPYYNWPSSYWPWRTGYDPDKHVDQVIAEHPDFILTGQSREGQATIANALLPWSNPGRQMRLFDGPSYLASHGYKETHRFCGEQPMHLSYSEEHCSMVFEPVTPGN